MNAKRALLILVSFLLGILFGNYSKIAYENLVFYAYTWEKPPAIVNCYGADFEEEQLIRAIEYWEHKGHHISFHEMKPSSEICDKTHLDGFIFLRKAKPNSLEDHTLAATTRRTRSGTMISASVHFSPGAQNLTNIIEHELGHAFGYGHVDIAGHIMHSEYGKMGISFWVP